MTLGIQAFIYVHTIFIIFQFESVVTSTLVTSYSVITFLWTNTRVLAFINISTKSTNFSKSWRAFTTEGTGGVHADVVMARAGIGFAFVYVLLTRFPGPPLLADTPLYIVTCIGTTPTFARGFTVFSIEKLATGFARYSIILKFVSNRTAAFK